jgi:hypothetical protein
MVGKSGAKDETRQRYFSDETATDSGLCNKAMEKAGVSSGIGVTAGWAGAKNSKHTPATFLSEIVQYRIAKYPGLAIVDFRKREKLVR